MMCFIIDHDMGLAQMINHYIDQISGLEMAGSSADPVAALKRLRYENLPVDYRRRNAGIELTKRFIMVILQRVLVWRLYLFLALRVVQAFEAYAIDFMLIYGKQG